MCKLRMQWDPGVPFLCPGRSHLEAYRRKRIYNFRVIVGPVRPALGIFLKRMGMQPPIAMGPWGSFFVTWRLALGSSPQKTHLQLPCYCWPLAARTRNFIDKSGHANFDCSWTLGSIFCPLTARTWKFTAENASAASV